MDAQDRTDTDQPAPPRIPGRPLRARRLPNKKWALAGGVLALLVVVALLANGLAGSGRSAQMYYADGPAAASAQTPSALREAGQPADGTAKTTNAPGWDRKVIRSGALQLEVTSVDQSLAAVRDVAQQAGGLVFSSNSTYQGDSLVATVTIQVPVEGFDTVMSSLRKLGVRVFTETSTSEDVTEEYTDLNSQLKNWQAQEDQLRVLMSRATTVDDTLSVQRELGTVRGQIEQAQGRLNYLSRRADLSTITISLLPPALAPAPTGWQPGNTAAAAWAASLAMLTQVADGVIGLVVFFWWVGPLLALAGWWLRRRSRAETLHRA